ncbi:hypothetical protein SODALDRAFT_355209 [Sodiomyces alkalinus F11]|uniref:Uncharacterized protein n=1 Tax=Sodiomyces alkalinus (strain CBS 110278 / VKM F-3762 / F11) TaxID=1314773 RepID=A0A3N2Q8P4_SODAK|nr:hypothetical protein SODALDRAFT_355209 [Sodiomyces alkalinus F11]ROT43018.1 hypothetical protein SODALDRAFT_355209 [Sodiomyces alkalinus F11]
MRPSDASYFPPWAKAWMRCRCLCLASETQSGEGLDMRSTKVRVNDTEHGAMGVRDERRKMQKPNFPLPLFSLFVGPNTNLSLIGLTMAVIHHVASTETLSGPRRPARPTPAAANEDDSVELKHGRAPRGARLFPFSSRTERSSGGQLSIVLANFEPSPFLCAAEKGPKWTSDPDNHSLHFTSYSH